MRVSRTLQSFALAGVSVFVAVCLAEARFRLLSGRGVLSADEIWKAQSEGAAVELEQIAIGGFHFSEEAIPARARAADVHNQAEEGGENNRHDEEPHEGGAVRQGELEVMTSDVDDVVHYTAPATTLRPSNEDPITRKATPQPVRTARLRPT